MRKSRRVTAGGTAIGGGAPVTVQSMTNTRTSDVDATAEMINSLEKAGCEIVRVAVPDMESARAIYDIKKATNLPIVADIHFDWRLAIAAAEAGADKIRINPGNIGARERVRAVADECRTRGLPIRIGVNGGSLEKDILEKYGAPTPEAMAESAMRHARLLEECDFNDIVISVKSSSVQTTVKANLLLAEMCDYPLHLGVTESGAEEMGVIKSAAGIGGLLAMGIGDTIRISLTAPPIKEIEAADRLLRAVGLRHRGAEIISCPTCGRCRVDLQSIVREVSHALAGVKTPVRVAVMGCAVNGPGEAREADVGAACGDGAGLIFAKGEILRKVPEEMIASELTAEVARITGEKI